MASIILGTIGKSILGPIGGAIGALAGSQIDNAINVGLSGRIMGASKLGNLKIQSSQDGANMPKIFGRARISGQIIWADKFKETKIKRTIGGKNGKKIQDYIYSISFAIGLCEGEISRLGRVWVNGALFDINQTEYRFYTGNNPNPDPLLEAVLGIDNCPKYNGISYIVFEDLALEEFGDRIPHFSFEVFANSQNDNMLESQIEGVCLIPASGEFAYGTTPIIETITQGDENYVNNHKDHNKTDFVCSIENLKLDLPNVKTISLVSSWFGTNINAEFCQILPKVEGSARQTKPRNWNVANIGRNQAQIVSQNNGKNAYGGSIDDKSILEAISHLKQNGFDICFNPFIMMDCANYPWRGRISLPSNIDGTNAVIAKINIFYGNTNAAHFTISGQNINYTGPNEWTYSRFILHHAALCKAAGGVESFLIGSELIGLTRLRDQNDNFPFIDRLIELAAQVRIILGAGCKIAYSADWTEYGAYYVANGNNTFFPCDKLWANSNIDFIGIDYYAPISDRADVNPENIETLMSNIEGGEAYDYFYANENARQARDKTPIIDNIYHEEWVYRQKDLRGFWSNSHYNRINGIKAQNPTPWVAKSKPIRFMELGFPAIDKGGNRPSVFPDAKSVENGIPPFSNGKRDDMEMRICLEAFLKYWNNDKNPISNIYSGRMIDIEKTHIWAWDARPFPEFPNLKDVWGDSENYEKGHWLNGRMNIGNVKYIFEHCLKALKISNYRLENIGFSLDGFVIEKFQNAREIIEFLMLAFEIKYKFEDGLMIFYHQSSNASIYKIEDLELLLDNEFNDIKHDFDHEAKIEGVSLSFYSAAQDYEIIEARIGENVLSIAYEFPIVLNENSAKQIGQNILNGLEKSRQIASIELPPKYLFEMQIGDKISFANDEIHTIETAQIANSFELKLSKDIKRNGQNWQVSNPSSNAKPLYFSNPLAFALDLPYPFSAIENPKPKFFLASNNFISPITIEFNQKPIAIVNKPAKIGLLDNDFASSNIALMSQKKLQVSMLFGQSLPQSGNAAIVHNGEILDIISFQNAQILNNDKYQISEIVRGLNGIYEAQNLPSGAYFILLDEGGFDCDLSNEFWGVDVICKMFAQNNQVQNHELKINFNAISQLPWSVCYLKARRINSKINISFLRRANGNEDSWENYSNNQISNYEIKILDINNNIKRTIFSQINSVDYINELDDFLSIQNHLKIEICEINDKGKKGKIARDIIEII